MSIGLKCPVAPKNILKYNLKGKTSRARSQGKQKAMGLRRLVMKRKVASFPGTGRQEWKMSEDAEKYSRREGSLTQNFKKALGSEARLWPGSESMQKVRWFRIRTPRNVRELKRDRNSATWCRRFHYRQAKCISFLNSEISFVIYSVDFQQPVNRREEKTK